MEDALIWLGLILSLAGFGGPGGKEVGGHLLQIIHVTNPLSIPQQPDCSLVPTAASLQVCATALQTIYCNRLNACEFSVECWRLSWRGRHPPTGCRHRTSTWGPHPHLTPPRTSGAAGAWRTRGKLGGKLAVPATGNPDQTPIDHRPRDPDRPDPMATPVPRRESDTGPRFNHDDEGSSIRSLTPHVNP